MVPQVAVYEGYIDTEEYDLNLADADEVADFLDQYFNDDIRYDKSVTKDLKFETVPGDAQEYLQHNFCSYSDLDWQCTEYKIKEEGDE